MQEIQTHTILHCPVCQHEGTLLHKELTDRLFHMPGFWDMKKCVNTDCATVWICNAPLESEIPKLYATYYTHEDITKESVKTVTEKKVTLLDKIRSEYIHTTYGYVNPYSNWKYTVLSKITYLHPAWKENLEATVFYLPAHVGGKLLEVGCGAGGTLEVLTKKGWVTTGTDFDEDAVANAKTKGLNVYAGELKDQKFPDESFDVVVMSHVIEHVPHPIELLTECRRVLKKGGTLTLLTPNADARGFAHFGRNWFALDTPRHLNLFTPKSLKLLAQESGFKNYTAKSTMHLAIHIWQMSYGLRTDNNFTRTTTISLLKKIKMQFVVLILGWIHILAPGKGEAALLICKK
jgi:2-polyprenyl-3-methyl-5-hydroxy-6-metoxy-1,4-benzoquinol methylase